MAVHEDLEMMLCFLWPQWAGIWRPAEAGSSFAPTDWRNIS